MKKNLLYGAIFIVALFTVLLLTGVINLKPQAIASSFTPIYCNDYEFSCCVPTQTAGTVALTATSNWQCPSNAIDCSITSYSPSTTYFYYTQNVPTIQKLAQNLFIPSYYAVDQVVKFSPSVPFTIPKGAYIWTDRSTTMSYKINGQKLTFCGTAGCTQGVDIKSDSCAFSVDEGKIYSRTGSDLGVSYTVPVGQCVLSWQSDSRHICGNVEEQCSSDSDCALRTTCNARTLQTYGCVDKSLPSGVSFTGSQYVSSTNDPLDTANLNVVTSRCELKTPVSVQCCGDTDCGSNAFCDKTSYTCKATTQCNVDSDCALSTQCDYATRSLKTPDCVSGQCKYSSQAVECCSDSNCPSGSFCNGDYNCEVSNPNIKTSCPTQCCVGFTGYFDKACPDGSYCSLAGSCISKPVCTSDDDCDITRECTNGECTLKDTICEDKLGGLIPSTLQTKVGLLGSKTYSCSYNYLFIILIFVSIMVLGLGYMYFKRKR